MERQRKQYTVQLEDEVIERIDQLAEKLEMNRSLLMRNLVLVGLEDAEILNQTGIIRAIKIGRDIREKFITDIMGGKLTVDKKGDWKIVK